jgi:hypothetical protein
VPVVNTNPGQLHSINLCSQPDVAGAAVKGRVSSGSYRSILYRHGRGIFL